MVFLIAVSYHSKAATGRPGLASLAPDGANGALPLWYQCGNTFGFPNSQLQANDVASNMWTLSGVDSVGFAVVLIGLHVCNNGCWVREFLDKAIEGQLGAVAGL
jgi:hypothetical protein